MNKIFFTILSIFSLIFLVDNVSAATYTPNTNLFEGTYTNNLFDMAYNQIENFTNKSYVIFQIDYNYYLVTSDDYTISDTNIIFNNSTIISALRVQSGSSYNYYYEYSTTNETQTIVNTSYIIVSNIKTNNTISGKRFNEYKFNSDIKNLGIFILGICFALFITKERRF